MSFLSFLTHKAPDRDALCEYRQLAKTGLDLDTRIALGALHELNRTGASATITADDAALIIKHILKLQEGAK
mgnify:CR=1 FL=1